MRGLEKFRSGKPGSYPDQSIYAEYACAEFGLAFQDIDGGTGLVFSVASKTKTIHFGAGRCSWYPQNNATASTLASDKYFANTILERAGAATLGGEYFFLHERHRARRAAGHDREDALEHFRQSGATAFVKPLLGSRGDFAQVLHGEASLVRYLDEVAQYYDSILIQPVLEAPRSLAAFALARKAARALGLRVAAVDMFTDIGGDPDAMRIIEVNSNPSIRLLEDTGRGDLILKIWHHTFSAMGLTGV